MADTYEEWLKERADRSKRVKETLQTPGLDADTRQSAIAEVAAIEADEETWRARQHAADLEAKFTRAAEITQEVVQRDPSIVNERDHGAIIRSARVQTHGSFDIEFSHVRRELELEAQGYTAREIVERAQTTTDAEGGYTIPTDLERSTYRALLAVPGVRQAGATVWSTSAGNERNLPVPTPPAKRTSGQITAEGTAVPEEDMTWGEVTLQSYKYSTSMELTDELLTDTAIPIEEDMSRSFGHTLGSLTNEAYTKGAGSSAPKGIAHSIPAARKVTTAAADKISLQDVQKTFASMPVGYIDSRTPSDSSFGAPRQGLVWMMHPLVWAHIVGREGTDGHPVFQRATDMNTRTILGMPVVFNEEFNSAFTTKFHVLTLANFRDFYIIRDVGGMRISWSPHVRFREGKIVYKAEMRTDGQLKDAAAARHLHLA